jgi:hypothetical protein
MLQKIRFLSRIFPQIFAEKRSSHHRKRFKHFLVSTILNKKIFSWKDIWRQNTDTRLLFGLSFTLKAVVCRMTLRTLQIWPNAGVSQYDKMWWWEIIMRCLINSSHSEHEIEILTNVFYGICFTNDTHFSVTVGKQPNMTMENFPHASLTKRS